MLVVSDLTVVLNKVMHARIKHTLFHHRYRLTLIAHKLSKLKLILFIFLEYIFCYLLGNYNNKQVISPFFNKVQFNELLMSHSGNAGNNLTLVECHILGNRHINPTQTQLNCEKKNLGKI